MYKRVIVPIYDKIFMEAMLIEWVAEQQIQLRDMEDKLTKMQSCLHAVFLGYALCTVVLVCYYKSSKRD